MSDRSHVDTEAMTDIENTDTTEDMQAIRLDVDDLLKFNASDVKGANVHGHRRGGSRKRKNHFSLRKSAAYVFGSHGSNRRSEHQHHHRHQYHHGRSHGWSKGVKILVAVLILFLALILIGAGVIAFKWYRAGSMNATMFKDKSTLQLQDAAPMQTINDDSVTQEEMPELPDTYTISYNGKTYAYNDNLVNLLFLGIDATNENKYEGYGDSAHQSDTLILAVMDVVKKKIFFINIPRDTVTDIRVLDAMNFSYVNTIKGPIAIQHGYGDGAEISDEATVNAVSNLLYSAPIYRYAAMNMSAIETINDAVGGVEVEILEDMTKWNKKMVKGTQYELWGKDATIYISRRDTSIDDSSIGRMKRQTQYLKALFQKGKVKTKEDILFPVTTYMEVKDSIHTNLTTDEITYLARQAIEMEISDENIRTIPGQMRHIEADEFYGYPFPMGYVTDDEALKQMIIDTFYYEVE